MGDGGTSSEPLAGGDDASRASINVVAAPDPQATASELRRLHRALIVQDVEALEQAVAARALPEADRIDVGPEQADELRRLAEELGRAERIRARTRTNVGEAIVRRLPGAGGVTVHPDTIRSAAAAVSAARAELSAAEAELAAPDGPASPPRVQPEPSELPEMFDEASVERARGRTMAAGVAVSAVGVALALVALGLVAIAGVVVIAGVSAAGWLYASRTRQARRAGQASEASAQLARLDAVLPPSDVAAERVEQRRRELEGARLRALERVRAAERHWAGVAGPDADPAEVESIVRVHDPQAELGPALDVSPTVRAVEALHRRAAARWRVAWAVLGVDEPPTLATLEARLSPALGTSGHAPLVIVEPSVWCPPDQLAAMLQELPPGSDVYIVTR